MYGSKPVVCKTRPCLARGQAVRESRRPMVFLAEMKVDRFGEAMLLWAQGVTLRSADVAQAIRQIMVDAHRGVGYSYSTCIMVSLSGVVVQP